MVIDLLIPQEARTVLPGDQIVAITQLHFEQTLLEQEFAGIGLERLATHISLVSRLQLFLVFAGLHPAERLAPDPEGRRFQSYRLQDDARSHQSIEAAE